MTSNELVGLALGILLFINLMPNTPEKDDEDETP